MKCHCKLVIYVARTRAMTFVALEWKPKRYWSLNFVFFSSEFILVWFFRLGHGNKYSSNHQHMAKSLQWKHIAITADADLRCRIDWPEENLVRAQRICHRATKTVVKTINDGADEYSISQTERLTDSHIFFGNAAKRMGNYTSVHWHYARDAITRTKQWAVTTTPYEVSDAVKSCAGSCWKDANRFIQ